MYNENTIRYVYAKLEEKLQNGLKKIGKLKMYNIWGPIILEKNIQTVTNYQFGAPEDSMGI